MPQRLVPGQKRVGRFDLRPVALGLAAGIGTMETLTYLRRHIVMVVVSGPSMSPTLPPGQRVLVARNGHASLRPGNIAVLAPPMRFEGSDRLWHIKRVVALPGDPVPYEARSAAGRASVPEGRLVALGDNKAMSFDSRQFGFYSTDGVLGIVVTRLWRGFVDSGHGEGVGEFPGANARSDEDIVNRPGVSHGSIL